MVVGYWNSGFKKWHDDGDQLVDRDEITDWMPLPDPPVVAAGSPRPEEQP